MTIGFDQVGDAKLLFTDKLLAATAPLSMAGVDEVEDEMALTGADQDIEEQD